MMTDSRKPWVSLLLCVALAVATLVVYWPLRNNEFIFCDDASYIANNPFVRAGLTWATMAWAFRTVFAANWHPLTWISLMIDAQFWHGGPEAVHLHNLVLHLLSSLLLLLTLTKMTGRIWASAFVAFTFALHPLHVESVAWAAERKDVLCGLFSALTLYCYARYATGSRYWLAPTLIAFVLALLSKPMAVTLPFVFLLLDYWPLQRVGNSAKSNRHLLFEKLPFFLLCIASSAITYVAQSRGGAVISAESLPVLTRVENVVISYCKYVAKALAPRGLAFYYPYQPSTLWAFGGALLLLAGVTLFVILQRKRRPYLFVGWFWFLGMLIPVIGIVQVGTQSMADRYMYFPIIGLTIMLAWGASELADRLHLKPLAVSCGIALVVAQAILTHRQVKFWHDTIPLATHAMQVTGDNAYVLSILGDAYANRHDYDQAIDSFQRALAMEPTNTLALVNLGNVFCRSKRYEEAKVCFDRVRQIAPDDVANLQSLGNFYFQRDDLNNAAALYERCLALDPEQLEVELNLALLDLRRGNLSDSDRLLRHLVSINSRVAETQFQFGTVLAREGKLSEAIDHFQRSLQLEPSAPQVHYALGQAYFRLGQVDRFVAQLRGALRLSPDYVEASQDLAWVLATDPDDSKRNPTEAVQLAERAAKNSHYRQASIMDTLAAAYASIGRFHDAVVAATTAIDLAQTSHDAARATNIQSRLTLYQANKAYIDAGLRPRK